MMRTEQGTRPLSFDPDGPGQPLVNSATTAWTGLPFEVHRIMPSRGRYSASPVEGQVQLRLILDGECRGEVLESGGRRRPFRIVPGCLSFHSGPTPPLAQAQGSARALVVLLPDAWLERISHQGTPPSQGSLRLPGLHPVVQHIGLAMVEEIAAGAPSGGLLAESLSMSLLAYALDRLPAAPMKVRGGLSGGQERTIRRFIEEHIGDELHLRQLATLCGLSERHFGTVFRRTFGKTPYSYVLERRLARGAELLDTTSYGIAEVALRTGFSSQSHFTTAFRRAYGTTPAKYVGARRRTYS